MIDAWNRVVSNLRIAEEGVCSRISSTTSDTPAELPAMAVEQINNYDAYTDIENSEIAVMSIIRIQVFSKKSLSEAREIMTVAADAMRVMGYRRYFGPQPLPNLGNTMLYRMEARFRRPIFNLDHDVPAFTRENDNP